MASHEFDLKRAEGIAGYRFNDRTILQRALQSPLKDRVDGNGEVIEDDGNRRLAKLGVSIMNLVLVDEWFSRGLGHLHLDLIQKTLLSKESLSDNAQQKGLHTCLSMSQRQENIAAPPTTMKLVLSALIGAVWLDSKAHENGILTNVKDVMAKLGFFDWDFLDQIY